MALLSAKDCSSLQSLMVWFRHLDVQHPLFSIPSGRLPPRVFQLPLSLLHLKEVHIHFERPLCLHLETASLSAVLAPFASMHRLERFSLDGGQTRFGCTDRDIDIMTGYWRRLRTLAVAFPVDSTLQTTPSVRALAHIAHGWPLLEVLCLPALLRLGDFTPFPSVVPHRALRQFNIVYTGAIGPVNLSEVKQFAVYLSIQFPNILPVASWDYSVNGTEPILWNPRVDWRRVLDLVQQALVIIRERRSGSSTSGSDPAA